MKVSGAGGGLLGCATNCGSRQQTCIRYSLLTPLCRGGNRTRRSGLAGASLTRSRFPAARFRGRCATAAAIGGINAVRRCHLRGTAKGEAQGDQQCQVDGGFISKHNQSPSPIIVWGRKRVKFRSRPPSGFVRGFARVFAVWDGLISGRFPARQPLPATWPMTSTIRAMGQGLAGTIAVMRVPAGVSLIVPRAAGQ